MTLKDLFAELLSGPKAVGLRRYMEACEYTYLDNDIRLLDDRGIALKEGPGSPLFVAMAQLAQAVYQASPHVGEEGISQVIRWLETALGPNYVRSDEIGQDLFAVGLSQCQVDIVLHHARLRVLELNRRLAENDSIADAEERNSLNDLVSKISAFESEDNKRQFVGLV